jgi:hypothetical protein
MQLPLLQHVLFRAAPLLLLLLMMSAAGILCVSCQPN